MTSSHHLVELRIDRDLFARFLADCEARRTSLERAGVEGGTGKGVGDLIDDLRSVIAELDRQIAQAEAEDGEGA